MKFKVYEIDPCTFSAMLALLVIQLNFSTITILINLVKILQMAGIFEIFGQKNEK